MCRITAWAAAMGLGFLGLSVPVHAAGTMEPEDTFTLMVDAGRMVAFTDRIGAALDIDNEEGDPVTPQAERTEVEHAADSIRSAALAYLSLKARACLEGKFTEISCTPSMVPAWLSEPANKIPPAEEIRRRSDALYTEMGPLLNAACEYGKEQMKDPMFCSVE